MTEILEGSCIANKRSNTETGHIHRLKCILKTSVTVLNADWKNFDIVHIMYGRKKTNKIILQHI